jgi:hypothetical protein
MDEIKERPKLEWQEFKTCTQEGSDFAIRIQTSKTGRPFYSLEFGRINTDGKFCKFIRTELNISNGKVEIKPFCIDDMTSLVDEAEAAILVDAQKREDEFQDRRRVWEARGDKQEEVRHTGKTARKRERTAGK